MKLDSEVAIPFYPYISISPTTKPMINSRWSFRKRRLRLKSWEGNCEDCCKKSIRTLVTIAKYKPKRFDFTKRIQRNYGYFIPDARLRKLKEKGEEPKYPVRFYRKNLSAEEILEMVTPDFVDADDSAVVYDPVMDSTSGSDCSESCEAY